MHVDISNNQVSRAARMEQKSIKCTCTTCSGLKMKNRFSFQLLLVVDLPWISESKPRRAESLPSHRHTRQLFFPFLLVLHKVWRKRNVEVKRSFPVRHHLRAETSRGFFWTLSVRHHLKNNIWFCWGLDFPPSVNTGEWKWYRWFWPWCKHKDLLKVIRSTRFKLN